MPQRYIPLRPGQRVRRSLGRTERPRPLSHLLSLFSRRRALPSYATPEECRRAHPGCEVWSVNVENPHA